MNSSTFDKQASQLAGGFSATPPQHAWAAIAARIPEQKRRGGAIWLWGLGAAAAISLLLVISYTTSTTEQGVLASSEQAIQAEVNEPPKPEVIADLIPVTINDEEQSAVASDKAVVQQQAAKAAFAKTSLPTATTKPSLESSVNPEAIKAMLAIAPETLISSQATATQRATSSVLTVDPINSLLLQDLNLSQPSLQGPRGLPCADFGDRGTWSLGVRIFTGAGPSGRELESNSENSAYSMMRDTVESVQLSVHGGLRLEAVHSKGLFVRLGADYQMQRSEISLLGNGTQSIEIVDVTHPITGQIIRRDSVFTTTTSEALIYNRHQTLSVTGGLGFRKSIGAVSPYLMAEAGYEFLIGSRGAMVDTDNLLVDLAETNDEWINERPGLHFGGVVGVDFALTDQLELGLSGHYRRQGGLNGAMDVLTDDRASLYGALNLRWSLY